MNKFHAAALLGITLPVLAAPVTAMAAPQDYTTPSTVTVPTPPTHSTVLGTSVTATSTAPASHTLPFTGSDVAGLTVVGVGLVGAGVVLVRRNRAKTAAK
jgi:LPXTG-motif cell wall-anchored protein